MTIEEMIRNDKDGKFHALLMRAAERQGIAADMETKVWKPLFRMFNFLWFLRWLKGV